MKKLNLKEVKECFELYRVAFQKKPFISNLAKELGVKSTELMKFIIDNDKHFILYSNDKGAYISQVYAELKDREGTDEFVEYNKEKYKNAIFLKPVCYDYSQTIWFNVVEADKKDEQRSNEWRNTPEKIDRIKPYLSDKRFTGGGFGDSYAVDYNNYLPKYIIEKLISEGWEFVNYNQNSKE